MNVYLEEKAKLLLVKDANKNEQVKREVCNEMYHFMKELGGDYSYTLKPKKDERKSGIENWLENAGSRVMYFEFMDRKVAVNIEVFS